MESLDPAPGLGFMGFPMESRAKDKVGGMSDYQAQAPFHLPLSVPGSKAAVEMNHGF